MPHVPAAGAPVAADRDQQARGAPAQRLVRQPPHERVPRRAPTPTPAAPPVRLDDPTSQHRPVGLEARPDSDLGPYPARQRADRTHTSNTPSFVKRVMV